MESKGLIGLGIFIGSIVGSYIPALWGAGMLSMSSVFFGALGAFAGLWLGYTIANW